MKAKTKPNPAVDEFTANPEDITPEEIAKASSPAEEQDGIFLRGLDGYEWKGQPLAPFNFQRRRAASTMGVRFGTLSDEESAEAEKTGWYKGIDTDVILLVWIHLQPIEGVLRAIRNPEQAFEKALEFGERESIEAGSPEFLAAAKFMKAIYTDLALSRGIYKQADGKEIKGKAGSKN